MSQKLKPKLEELVVSLSNIVKDVDIDSQQTRDAKGELGELPYRVIHLKQNPAKFEFETKEAEFERVKKENERLKARLELLETGNHANVTRDIDVAVNNANRVQELSRALEEYKRRETKILDSFRKTSREYRKAVSFLTGYKMDALKDGKYQLYLENEDEHLSFQLGQDSSIELLPNDYSDQFSHLVSTYLKDADSYPAFLAAITLDSFKQSTQSSPMSMSMSMSTTLRPNPLYNPR